MLPVPSSGGLTVNTNVASLMAQQNVSNSMAMFQRMNERLSTGIRLNRGSDDPAGLIAAEALRAELSALQAAEKNASRAFGAISTIDSALGQVSDLLNNINGNIVSAAGAWSNEEKAALQLETQAALEAIDRIGASTGLGGTKLLEGSMEKLTFALSPDVSQTVDVPLEQIASSTLGGADGLLSDLAAGGAANLLDGDLEKAQRIVSQAKSQLLDYRGRLGATQKYTIDTAREVLGAAEISVSSALSEIRDTDFAVTSSKQVSASILTMTGIETMRLANQSGGLLFSLLKQW